MKSKKVLIGLIVTAFVGFAGICSAQTKANYQNNLIEIGPDNIGGRTRTIIADKSDSTNSTLYAAGVAGGLYRVDGVNTSWSYVPISIDGKETTLPISYMVQTPDNMIYIATGEGLAVGDNASDILFAPKGRGLYRFNPANQSCTLVSGTSGWEYINRLTYLERNDSLYFYAATNNGLFRWTVANNGTWGNPETVFSAGAVQDVEIISGDNMAFFTSGSHLYKISNVTHPAQSGTKYTDISTSNPAFGGDALRIELAAAKSDQTYLYAVVAKANGLLDAVYLTHDQQNWTRLTTPTITLFTSNNNGWHNSAITVDPTNHKRIIIGGAALWVGEGFVEGSYYQWTKASYTEDELNGGNYMESVYPSSLFVHSGIHEILPVLQTVDGVQTYVYYFATDGGVYKTTNNFETFNSKNKGFNTVQFNSIAVAPDGSILGGAVDNSCPFIQSRNDHDGGEINNTWYDNGSARNHIGNVLWFGNGGQVEASMFQQVLPTTHRGLFFSATGGDFVYSTSSTSQNIANVGRAYNDYTDYTNTQTWTTAESFIGTSMAATNSVPQMALFETTNNQANDSISFTIDTLGYFYRGGVQYSFQDATVTGGNAGEYQLKSGDQVIVPSKPHFNYPFTYTFDHNFTVKNEMTHKVHNPIASRMFIAGQKDTSTSEVIMTMTPTDYSKVWSSNNQNSPNANMNWYSIFQSKSTKTTKCHTIGQLAVANDGDAVFINAITPAGLHYIMRCSNLNACDANEYSLSKNDLVYNGPTDENRITNYDTIFLGSDNYFFDRPITSMFIDRRAGKDVLLITLGGNNATTPNLYVVKNASNPATRTITAKVVKNGNNTYNGPIYSGMIEYTTGTVYVGTYEGVFTATESSFNGTPTWNTCGSFHGVPVTSIRQQTNSLKRESYIAHTGINAEKYLFAKTKYPYAIYFGTSGRGVFMDMTYVTDTTNDIVNTEDFAGITNVNKGDNKISIYPNPASNYGNINRSVTNESNAVIKVYDLSGRLVYSENLGRIAEGNSLYRLNCQNFHHGMYLININFGQQSATSKLIVR